MSTLRQSNKGRRFDHERPWRTCTTPDCVGVRYRRDSKCLAHLDEEQLRDALRRVGSDGVVDARGVSFGSGLSSRLRRALPRDEDGRPWLLNARFSQATFDDVVEFRGVQFKGTTWFDHARFNARVSFEQAAFEGVAEFRSAVFRDVAWFDRVLFSSGAWLDQAIFCDIAWFGRATFEYARQIGPVLVHKALVLDVATFKQRVNLDVTAATVCCRRSRFLEGGRLRIRWAEVFVEDADFTSHMILSSGDQFPLRDAENEAVRKWQKIPGSDRSEIPTLMSVQRANVANLTVSRTDLTACRFAEANNLDQLRLEGGARFSSVPRGFRRSRRQVVAEEYEWRASRRAKGWAKPYWPPWTPRPDPLSPSQIAGIYRALRKGREDRKDEPGAADFYYGEMEMRRHDPVASRPERLVLFLYWLLSGYALRASRAVTGLALVIVLFAILFQAVGFAPAEPSLRVKGVSPSGAVIYKQPEDKAPSSVKSAIEAIAYSAGSTVAIVSGPERKLTTIGQCLRILLRLIGPILLGLSVLSIRGRVKR
jgi:hypothetical protein